MLVFLGLKNEKKMSWISIFAKVSKGIERKVMKQLVTIGDNRCQKAYDGDNSPGKCWLTTYSCFSGHQE